MKKIFLTLCMISLLKTSYSQNTNPAFDQVIPQYINFLLLQTIFFNRLKITQKLELLFSTSQRLLTKYGMRAFYSSSKEVALLVNFTR